MFDWHACGVISCVSSSNTVRETWHCVRVMRNGWYTTHTSCKRKRHAHISALQQDHVGFELTEQTPRAECSTNHTKHITKVQNVGFDIEQPNYSRFAMVAAYFACRNITTVVKLIRFLGNIAELTPGLTDICQLYVWLKGF